MDLLASEQQIAALSPPELVDLVVELSSGGG